MRRLYWLFLVPVLLAAMLLQSACQWATVGRVVMVCSATQPGTVNVTFNWRPTSEPTGVQYLDLSVYSTFPPGTFLGAGPYDASVSSLSWDGLTANTVHHWRVNTLVNGEWYTSTVGTFTTIDCGTGDGSAPWAGMRMVIPKIGVNAPVNARIVGTDGVMGIPNGKDDVIWYDFEYYDGLGGFPGTPGSNALFSGHVDYHPHYTAVFWDLRLLGPGDEIDVVLRDNSMIRYRVDWTTWIGNSDNFGGFAVKNGFDTLTIVTCIGTFDTGTRNYSNRLVVRASRIY